MDDTPTISYVNTTPTTNSQTWNYMPSTTTNLGANVDFLAPSGPWTGLAQQNLAALGGIGLGLQAAAQSTSIQKEAKKILAKLIRYTVVNPDQHLIETKPELAILLEGKMVLNGADEKGFLLEIAPKIQVALDTHNLDISTLTYKDKDGKRQPFDKVRISQLDVVVETVKQYTA